VPEFDIQLHPKFCRLLNEPHSYANIWGGRGGMKSIQTHKAALIDAINRPIRTCCARETMASIKDSSHKLLEDTIHEYGMAKSQNGPYEVLQDRIRRMDGEHIASEFIFVGIRENVRDQKSLYKIHRTIIEEAAKVSQDSLTVFIPTVMREEGAQTWFIWNPELVTDPTYQFLMTGNAPPRTIHIETNYLENPWLSETMRALADHSKRTNPEEYDHVWLGKPISGVKGAIFELEMKKALAEGRITKVPYNRSMPVDTVWDLGFGDNLFIWFVQAYDGWYHFIDCFETHAETIHSVLKHVQAKEYVYGVDFMPHDALDTIIHKKLAASSANSIESIMRAMGRNVRLVAKTAVHEQINSARTMFPLCRFDEEKCLVGIEHLRMYQFGPPSTQGVPKREPLHNEHSHAGSAFQYVSWAVKQPRKETQKPQGKRMMPASAWS